MSCSPRASDSSRKQEALLKGLTNKIPKAVAATADVLLQTIRRVRRRCGRCPPTPRTGLRPHCSSADASNTLLNEEKALQLRAPGCRAICACAPGPSTRLAPPGATCTLAPKPLPAPHLVSFPAHVLSFPSGFGVRVVKPTPILKAVGPLFDHKDSTVRDKAKDIAVRAGNATTSRRSASPLLLHLSQLPGLRRYRPQVELTRWMGPAAVKRDMTDKMRDAQKKEARELKTDRGGGSTLLFALLPTRPKLPSLVAQVEEALEGIESGRVVPTRFLRKEAERQKELLAAAAAAAAEGGEKPAAAGPPSAAAVRAATGPSLTFRAPCVVFASNHRLLNALRLFARRGWVQLMPMSSASPKTSSLASRKRTGE